MSAYSKRYKRPAPAPTRRSIGATGYAALLVLVVVGVLLIASGALTLLYNALGVVMLALVAHCVLRPTRHPLARWAGIAVVLTFVVVFIQEVWR